MSKLNRTHTKIQQYWYSLKILSCGDFVQKIDCHSLQSDAIRDTDTNSDSRPIKVIDTLLHWLHFLHLHHLLHSCSHIDQVFQLRQCNDNVNLNAAISVLTSYPNTVALGGILK